MNKRNYIAPSCCTLSLYLEGSIAKLVPDSPGGDVGGGQVDKPGDPGGVVEDAKGYTPFSDSHWDGDWENDIWGD